MEGASTRGEKWTLTKEALDAFLAFLDADRERAAQKYELIRQKLSTFFRCNGFWDVEDKVDETIDRVVRRLADTQIREVMAFFRGVARHVASEARKKGARGVALEDVPELPARGAIGDRSDPDFDRRLECLERSVSGLTEQGRKLILEYYTYERSEKIENKRKLAQQMGISPATLRVRAFRLRQQLEKLVAECMEEQRG